MHGVMREDWHVTQGTAMLAPPDEREGNRYANLKEAVPVLYSTRNYT